MHRFSPATSKLTAKVLFCLFSSLLKVSNFCLAAFSFFISKQISSSSLSKTMLFCLSLQTSYSKFLHSVHLLRYFDNNIFSLDSGVLSVDSTSALPSLTAVLYLFSVYTRHERSWTISLFPYQFFYPLRCSGYFPKYLYVLLIIP